MSSKPYYSQRQGRQVIRDQEGMGERFWTAFTGYISELLSNNFLAEAFPEECPDGKGVCSWNTSLLRARLIGELPDGEWPLPNEVPSNEAVFDYIEFLYRVVSKPKSGYAHSFFGHVDFHSFDSEDARSEYSARVNQYLYNCRHPYDLVDGGIRSSVSPVLDTPMREEEFVSDDSHLVELLRSSIADFYDRSGQKKQKALESLVDAYERLKTIEDPNKKISTKAILSRVSPFEAIQQSLDDDMKVLTKIANDFTIRHHEMTKRKLGDDDYTEYLFYAYYNVIRLILKKYGKLNSSKAIQTVR